jgi:hypothetical protein
VPSTSSAEPSLSPGIAPASTIHSSANPATTAPHPQPKSTPAK